MKYRNLGRTNIKVSVIGIGCGRLGSLTNGGSSREAIYTLEEAIDNGITFFDTADIYGQGDSEKLLGKTLKKYRDSVVIETKAGNVFSQKAKLASKFKRPLRPLLRRFKTMKDNVKKLRAANIKQNFDPVYLEQALNMSLKRLQTDFVDIFMLHNPTMDVILRNELSSLVERLKETGKIRAFAISCQTTDEVKAAIQVSTIDVIQVPVGVAEYGKLEKNILTAHKHGIGIVGRSPFSGGHIFTQKGISTEISNDNSRVTPAHLALQSAISHTEVATVLVGTSSRKHLRENIQAISTDVIC